MSVTPPDEHRDAERLVFFTDAVVAIAMTLLVLPLMEAATESGEHAITTTTDFVHEHAWHLYTFVLSFTIIASFWSTHHKVWEHVRWVDPTLRWLNTLWQMCIVWLPVATAMVGSRMTKDWLQYVLYIGPQLLSMMALTATVRHLHTHPELLDDPDAARPLHGPLARGVVVALYVVALALPLVVPAISYYSMFVLLLIWPAARVLRRRG